MTTKRVPMEQRRAGILLAARKAYARKGFFGTRAKDLAAACGMSEGLLFKCFSSKSDLEGAVLAELVRNLRAARPVPQSKVAPLRGLREISARLLNLVRRYPSLIRLMLFATLEERREGPVLFRELLIEPVNDLSSLFRVWIRGKRIKKSVDVRRAAWAYACMLLQGAILDQVFGFPGITGHTNLLSLDCLNILQKESIRGARAAPLRQRLVPRRAVGFP
jgi:AcrR family transcriptional regulator